MLEQLAQDTGRDGDNIRTNLRRFDDMVRAADRCDQHFRLESLVIGVNSADFLDQAHAVTADIVQPANEG